MTWRPQLEVKGLMSWNYFLILMTLSFLGKILILAAMPELQLMINHVKMHTLGSQQVFQFPSSNNICWEKEKVFTCYALACRDNKTKPAIVVKSSNQRYKTEILRQSKKPYEHCMSLCTRQRKMMKFPEMVVSWGNKTKSKWQGIEKCLKSLGVWIIRAYLSNPK